MALPLALEPWPIDSKNARASLGRRPPTSTARTTNCALLLGLTSLRSDLLALCSFQNRSVLQCSVPPRGSICIQCTHQSGVHCRLSSPSEWQTVHDDFQPPCIRHPWFWQVHVPHDHIRSYASSCLTAYHRCSALHSKPSTTQHPYSGTSCTMMAKNVEKTATSAIAFREGERLTNGRNSPIALCV